MAKTNPRSKLTEDAYYQYAFLSAYTNIPALEEPNSFFTDHVESIFIKYKKSLEQMRKLSMKGRKSKIPAPKKDILYTPIPYCLLGDFDLAVFSLIDDFSFATRKFKPTPGPVSFKYQINTGIIPKVEVYKKKYSLIPKFTEKDIPNFFSKKKFYPFTGIVSIKLNNTMLVGIGQEFVDLINTYIIAFVDSEIEKKRSKGLDMFYMINENLGWNELSIYFFSNSTESINDIVLSIRNLTLGKIISDFKKWESPAYDKLNTIKKLKQSLSKIKRDSLLAYLISKSEIPGDHDIKSSHPILGVSITYGLRLELIDPAKGNKTISKLLNKRKYGEVFQSSLVNTMISVGWNVKPGHEYGANEIITKCFTHLEKGLDDESIYTRVQSSRYPFIYPNRRISLQEYIEFLAKAVNKSRSKKICQHINRFRSRVSFHSKDKLEKADFEKHFFYDLNSYRINKEDHETISEQLRVYPIPHTLKSQVENLILNFNDAISDPLIFNYFIGMKESLIKYMNNTFYTEDPFASDVAEDELKLIVDDDNLTLKSPAGTVPESFQAPNIDNLSSFVQAWNKAYWNRYFHSYYFTDITDFNIEHHGGVQQILFAYDRIYKLLEKRIYGPLAKSAFVNVQVSPNITSTEYYNNINFIHLFRPAVFACECVHEVANHIITCLVRLTNEPRYLFLINPRIENTPDAIAAEMEDFEKNLRLTIGTKDNFEVEYLKSNFGLNLIRQVITDYATYRIAYQEGAGRKGPQKLAKVFYFAHWFLMLTRAQHYSIRKDRKGSWYFKDDEFRILFIRFNLMFYLMLGFTKKDLITLNEDSPSIELSMLWKTESASLIEFVCRLGDGLKKEFINKIKHPNGLSGFKAFKSDIDTLFIDAAANNLSVKELNSYREFIEFNYELISDFHRLFQEDGMKSNNILIRRSSQRPLGRAKSSSISNVDFYPGLKNRSLFLDPKGNLFTTHSESRRTVFSENIKYIKRLWDLSMRTVIHAYQES